MLCVQVCSLMSYLCAACENLKHVELECNVSLPAPKDDRALLAGCARKRSGSTAQLALPARHLQEHVVPSLGCQPMARRHKSLHWYVTHRLIVLPINEGGSLNMILRSGCNAVIRGNKLLNNAGIDVRGHVLNAVVDGNEISNSFVVSQCCKGQSCCSRPNLIRNIILL